ncbi:MAG: hypothetical protein JO358_21380 [Alphaproteobacteria bacterium]|nr:hypothetical protein [Alphaproteobacteria bacterium]
MKPHLARLERIAEEMNVWLLAIAFGLAVLYVTAFVAKCLQPLALAPASSAAEVTGPKVAPRAATNFIRPEPRPVNG